MVAAAAGGVEVGRLEHRADAPDRLFELAVAVAEHERLTGGRLGQSQQQPERRRLAGAVGPRKPVTVPASSENVTSSTATSSP